MKPGLPRLVHTIFGSLLILLASCNPGKSGTDQQAAPTSTSPSAPAGTPVACLATFTPLGFPPDNDRLLGWQTLEGQTASRLQALDLKTLQPETIYEYDGSGGWPVLSPDGQLAAVPQPDHSVQLIHLPDGTVQATLSRHDDFISAMVFSPAGDRLYTGSRDTFVRVWGLSGNLLAAFQPDGADQIPSEVTGMGISPDGRQLVTIPLEGRIKVWDAANFTQSGEYEGSIFGSYNGSGAAFSPDGRYLAVGLAAGPGAVSLWRVSDGTLLWQGGFFGFAFSPDGKIFAHTQIRERGGSSEEIVLSSVDGQIPLRTLDETYPTPIGRLIFSRDGTRLAVFTFRGNTQIWDVTSGRKLLNYQASCR